MISAYFRIYSTEILEKKRENNIDGDRNDQFNQFFRFVLWVARTRTPTSFNHTLCIQSSQQQKDTRKSINSTIKIKFSKILLQLVILAYPNQCQCQ